MFYSYKQVGRGVEVVEKPCTNPFIWHCQCIVNVKVIVMRPSPGPVTAVRTVRQEIGRAHV